MGCSDDGRTWYMFCSCHVSYCAVIGRKVNLAARMMMHYPGLVSCDQETYQDSKLPAYLFSELPPTEMKGVANPGTLYQYLGSKEET